MMRGKSKTPQIRFKGFSGEWKNAEIGDYADIIAGGTPSTSNPIYWNPKQIPWMSSGEINKKRLFFTDNQISEIGLENSSAKWIKSNCVLIALAGQGKTRGTVAINHIPLTTNQSIAAIVPNEKLYFEFLYQNLENRYDELRTKSSGDGSRGGLNKQIISQISIDFPEITEQTKIGDYFQNLDKLIEQKEQKYQKLRQFKTAMLSKMFPQNGATTPEIRFKGFSGEWESEKLEKIANFSKGQGYSKNDLVEIGTPIILYGRLYTKYQTTISEIDTFVKQKTSSTVSKGNEVVVPASGETAEEIARASAIISAGFLIGGDLNIIYPDDRIDNIFLALSISNGKTQKDLSKKAQGKSVVHLRNNDLKEIDLLYPTIEEQTKIGNYFEKLDTLIDLHAQELEKLRHIKKASLEKMFV